MDTSKIYLISDTHFQHSNIIKYCNRPFANKDEMDEYIIKKWNETIGKNDRVFFLGDFAFCGKDKLKWLGNRLNGRKIFIFGNHDSYSPGTYFDAGFEQVSKYPIFLPEYEVILSHDAIPNTKYFNIHGHHHGKNLMTVPYIKKNYHLYFDVGADPLCFTPIRIEDVLYRNY